MKAMDAEFAFKTPRRLPALEPTRACTGCKRELDTQIIQYQTLLEEIKKHGITQAAAMEFIRDIIMGHDDFIIGTLASFIVAAAQDRLKNAKLVASNFVVGFLKSGLLFTKRARKSMVKEVPTKECQWHNQQEQSEELTGLIDDQGDGSGATPPAPGPMYG